MSVLNEFSLQGKVAVVTGGSKGIGDGMVMGLAQAGADVAVVSRTPGKGQAGAVEALGRRCLHVPADLTDRAQTRAVVPKVLAELGRVDILVNNAGICPRAPVEEFPEEYWDATIEINLTAAFILTQAAGRDMLSRGWGRVINTASVLSFQGGFMVPAYASSKHGIAGLTKSFANEWGARGVTVNAIAPGYFSTELTQDLENNPDISSFILSRTPVGRWGRGEDIAGLTVFLASPSSAFVNGAIFNIDGGWLAR